MRRESQGRPCTRQGEGGIHMDYSNSQGACVSTAPGEDREQGYGLISTFGSVSAFPAFRG